MASVNGFAQHNKPRYIVGTVVGHLSGLLSEELKETCLRIKYPGGLHREPDHGNHRSKIKVPVIFLSFYPSRKKIEPVTVIQPEEPVPADAVTEKKINPEGRRKRKRKRNNSSRVFSGNKFRGFIVREWSSCSYNFCFAKREKVVLSLLSSYFSLTSRSLL